MTPKVFPHPILEVCAGSLQSAYAAQSGGATRIELCAQLDVGGITPSAATIQMAVQHLTIPVFVMIRPRAGDFLYTDLEFELMKQDILFAKRCGAKGVVFGILTANSEIDIARNKELVRLAQPMNCTFHMAFDRVKDRDKALEDVVECGFTRILTAGLKQFAIDGLQNIKELVQLAGNRISIMPGSGINALNIEKIVNETRVSEVHSSCSSVFSSTMEDPIIQTPYELVFENKHTEESKVKEFVDILLRL